MGQESIEPGSQHFSFATSQRAASRKLALDERENQEPNTRESTPARSTPKLAAPRQAYSPRSNPFVPRPEVRTPAGAVARRLSVHSGVSTASSSSLPAVSEISGGDEAQSAWLMSPEVSVDEVKSSWEAVGRLCDRATESRTPQRADGSAGKPGLADALDSSSQDGAVALSWLDMGGLHRTSSDAHSSGRGPLDASPWRSRVSNSAFHGNSPTSSSASGLSSPPEAGAPFLNAAGYVYTGITPARPASAAAAARGRAHGARDAGHAESHQNPNFAVRHPASAGGAGTPRWATPAGSDRGVGFGLEGAGSAGSASLLSSADGFPRSFQLVRSGSTESLASLQSLQSLADAPPRSPKASAAAGGCTMRTIPEPGESPFQLAPPLPPPPGVRDLLRVAFGRGPPPPPPTAAPSDSSPVVNPIMDPAAARVCLEQSGHAAAWLAGFGPSTGAGGMADQLEGMASGAAGAEAPQTARPEPPAVGDGGEAGAFSSPIEVAPPGDAAAAPEGVIEVQAAEATPAQAVPRGVRLRSFIELSTPARLTPFLRWAPAASADTAKAPPAEPPRRRMARRRLLRAADVACVVLALVAVLAVVGAFLNWPHGPLAIKTSSHAQPGHPTKAYLASFAATFPLFAPPEHAVQPWWLHPGAALRSAWLAAGAALLGVLALAGTAALLGHARVRPAAAAAACDGDAVGELCHAAEQRPQRTRRPSASAPPPQGAAELQSPGRSARGRRSTRAAASLTSPCAVAPAASFASEVAAVGRRRTAAPAPPDTAATPLRRCRDTGLPCDRTGQQAVACYAGNFLVKMLSELAGGERKSVQHVLVHLLPYLGGSTTLAALRVDSPDDPECRVCYKDLATADGLTSLREALSAAQLQVYDEQKVCYALLAQRILAALPQTDDGVWLMKSSEYGADAFAQSVGVFETLFEDSGYDTASCRLADGAGARRQALPASPWRAKYAAAYEKAVDIGRLVPGVPFHPGAD
ncbi:hypothetical protein WJX81_002612 [Elliptochloris bilobata]|uniref:Uncharacterized protein n=1 Tax=Elliptochloris bilobata TaxID=381761 RepID=A0AAW1QZL3_9CHLO